MAMHEAFIKQHLSKYAYKGITEEALLSTITAFPDLRPKEDTFVFPDSLIKKSLLCLNGTIPVLFKGRSYNIPMCIWLFENFPYKSPWCYIKSTQDMLIKPSRHVDSKGRVYLPYLHEWKHPNSDLIGLVEVMAVVFGENSPVYSRGTSPLRAPLEDCVMCEGKPGTVHCDKCQNARCVACDRQWHSYPKKKSHQRKLLVSVMKQSDFWEEKMAEETQEDCFVCGEIPSVHCVTCPNFFCPACEDLYHTPKERQSHGRIKIGMSKKTQQDAPLWVGKLHAANEDLVKNGAYALMEKGFNFHQAKHSLDRQHSQKGSIKGQEQMEENWKVATHTSTAKVIVEIEKDCLEKIRRVLMTEHNMVWAAVDVVFALRKDHELSECIEAVEAVGNNLQRARDYFKECHTCYVTAPMSKLLTLPLCQCRLCKECVMVHFSVLVQSTSCMDRFVCPACSEPDLESCTPDEYEAHFSLLSGMGCGAGFINERLGAKKLQCPDCRKFQCFSCMKPWMDQHKNISCEEFDAWKKNNDPEFQQQGLAAHLKENGINCPKCKMRYELAKGGCMHFKCPHCRHEFCCGCNLPFLCHPACQKLPSCKDKGLHAHHPRDCFYHLRDEECEALQQLLMKHNVAYNQSTNAAAADNGKGSAKCPVKEQHERPNGLEDTICGKAVKDKSGLCENHYKEYLVGLINQHNIDPVDILNAVSLEATLRRNDKKIPNRVGNEADVAYCARLRQSIG